MPLRKVNSWHYTWSVFHDPQGHRLMGGKTDSTRWWTLPFILPPVLMKSYYEPSSTKSVKCRLWIWVIMHMATSLSSTCSYMYNYSGQPWKATLDSWSDGQSLYTQSRRLAGDEDNGQTSARYVFSAMDSIRYVRVRMSIWWYSLRSNRWSCIWKMERQ